MPMEDIKQIVDNLCLKIYPSFEEIKMLVSQAINVLAKEPILVEREYPLIIVGDIFGHFQDLKSIFEINGLPKDTSYLFLGNYVDKGHFSLFVILYLLGLKIMYPEHMTLLRGAHETKSLNRLYGFTAECKQIYKTDQVWLTISEIYQYLPIASVVKDANVG